MLVPSAVSLRLSFKGSQYERTCERSQVAHASECTRAHLTRSLHRPLSVLAEYVWVRVSPPVPIDYIARDRTGEYRSLEQYRTLANTLANSGNISSLRHFDIDHPTFWELVKFRPSSEELLRIINFHESRRVYRLGQILV